MAVVFYAIIILLAIFALLLRVWKDRMNETNTPKPNDLNDADRYNDTAMLQEQINNDQIFMQP